jgi:hypothetical protein
MCSRIFAGWNHRRLLVWRKGFTVTLPQRLGIAYSSSTEKPDVRKLAEMARIEITDEQVC